MLGDIPKIFDMLQTEEFSGTRVGVASRHVMQQMSNDAPCRKNARALTHIYAHTYAHAKHALAHAYRRHADARKRGRQYYY